MPEEIEPPLVDAATIEPPAAVSDRVLEGDSGETGVRRDDRREPEGPPQEDTEPKESADPFGDSALLEPEGVPADPGEVERGDAPPPEPERGWTGTFEFLNSDLAEGGVRLRFRQGRLREVWLWNTVTLQYDRVPGPAQAPPWVAMLFTDITALSF